MRVLQAEQPRARLVDIVALEGAGQPFAVERAIRQRSAPGASGEPLSRAGPPTS